MDTNFASVDAVAPFLEQLLARVHVPGSQQLGALFSVAYATSDHAAPQFLTGRCLFEQQSSASRRHEYPGLTLDEWWAPTTDALRAVVATLRGAAGLNGMQTPPFFIPSVRRFWSDRPNYHEHFTDYPEWILEASANRGNATTPSTPSGPVVRQGLRPYSSGNQALLDWIWRSTASDSSNAPHDKSLVVVVPDLRSRIRAADWRGRTVSVSVEAREGDLELQGIALAGASHQSLPTVLDPNNDRVSDFAIPEGTERVELFLVRRDGDLADQFTMFTATKQFEVPPEQALPGERAALELSNGEREEVEFKPFITPRNHKEREIVETVVAFANTSGGRLYVGVLDNGSPEGQVALRRASGLPPTDGLKLLADRLQALIREHVKPVPDLTVQAITVAGEPIIAVSVPRSSAGPYCTHENDVYIRKGATNRKPDPKTELPHLATNAISLRDILHDR